MRDATGRPIPVAPARVRELIARLFPAAGPIPRWFAMTNAALESGFRAEAHLDAAHDDSYGLMMVNMKVPSLRAIIEELGRTPNDLYDPEFNLTFWRDRQAKVFKAGARAHGFAGDAVWEAVRLRLAGIPWEDFQTSKARYIASRFWRFAGRYR